MHSIKSGKLLKTVTTKKYGDRPRGIKVSPSGNTYVVTLEFGNKLLVLNKQFKIVRAVPTGNGPYGISFDRRGKLIYVSAAKDKLLQVFDARTYEKLREVSTGARCWHFSFTPDDKQILLACGKSDNILLFDTETLKNVGEITGTKMPWGIVTSPKSPGSLDAP